MKAAAVSLLLMLTLMSIFNVESASKDTVDCSIYEGAQFCTDDFKPICGSDGKTYSNECAFCIALNQSNDKLKFGHKGEC